MPSTPFANGPRAFGRKGSVGFAADLERGRSRFGTLVGDSPAMEKVYDLISRVARTRAGVMISGETGTGKEVVAQTIHSLSARRNRPFIALNCGALPPHLIESELFGHERGSFTGADRRHHGYFERAHRGTLFLDEITAMPRELQTRLLRVLENETLCRVGGTQVIELDVRIIAATNQRPEQAVAAGLLREDLFYRLDVFPIAMPPLCERGNDSILLAESFLRALNTGEGTNKAFSKASVQRLRSYHWPGNVRELRNVVHRSFIMAETVLEVDCSMPPAQRMFGNGFSSVDDRTASSTSISVGISLAEAERRLILTTLQFFGRDKQGAANALGLCLKTIYTRLRNYEARRVAAFILASMTMGTVLGGCGTLKAAPDVSQPAARADYAAAAAASDALEGEPLWTDTLVASPPRALSSCRREGLSTKDVSRPVQEECRGGPPALTPGLASRP